MLSVFCECLLATGLAYLAAFLALANWFLRLAHTHTHTHVDNDSSFANTQVTWSMLGAIASEQSWHTNQLWHASCRSLRQSRSLNQNQRLLCRHLLLLRHRRSGSKPPAVVALRSTSSCRLLYTSCTLRAYMPWPLYTCEIDRSSGSAVTVVTCRCPRAAVVENCLHSGCSQHVL